MAAKFGCQGAIRPPEVDAQRMGAQRGCQASGARIVILCHVVRLKACSSAADLGNASEGGRFGYDIPAWIKPRNENPWMSVRCP